MDSNNQLNAGSLLPFNLKSWAPNYGALAALFKSSQTYEASVAVVRDIAEQIASAVNMPLDAVEVVLMLEASYPERPNYRAASTRDDGSPLYRGITQASKGFWFDVYEQAEKKGLKLSARRPEAASLEEQIAAPFIYLDRYRASVRGHLFTPAMIYSLHQQGPGGAESGFVKPIGEQSGRSLDVVRVARLGARGIAKTAWL